MPILLKYTIWLHSQDCGDGSVAVKIFDTEAQAKEYAARAEEEGYDRHEGDIEFRSLIFQGTHLVNPDDPSDF